MTKALWLECGCGHQWAHRLRLVELGDFLASSVCPQCGRPGATAGRGATTMHDPVRDLEWCPTSTRPEPIHGWACVELDRARGYCVSIWVLPDGSLPRNHYDIFLNAAGKFREAYLRGPTDIYEVAWENVPRHLLDLATSIAVGTPPIVNWEAWTRAAVICAARSRGDLNNPLRPDP